MDFWDELDGYLRKVALLEKIRVIEHKTSFLQVNMTFDVYFLHS